MFVRAIPMQGLLREERGASAVEYGLLIALIAVIVIAAVGVLGVNLSEIFDAIADALEGATP